MSPAAPNLRTNPHWLTTVCVAEAAIPTIHGEFHAHVFRLEKAGPGAKAMPGPGGGGLVFGDVRSRGEVLVRVHSECITSEIFGSLKCDCKEQLDASMAAVARDGAGAVLYLRQEGRGIG